MVSLKRGNHMKVGALKRNFCESLAEIELKEAAPQPCISLHENPLPKQKKRRRLKKLPVNDRFSPFL